MQKTNANGLAAARELFQTDWDEGGTVPVHLPADLAVDLLDRLGWKFTTVTSRTGRHDPNCGRWVAPDGSTSWHIEEALQLALAAEVL